MAWGFISIDDIVTGRIDFKIHMRIIRLWRQPNFKNRLQINIELILIDEKVHFYTFTTNIMHLKWQLPISLIICTSVEKYMAL